MPKTPETPRSRIRLLAVGYMFIKSKFPAKQQIQTASLRLFDHYIEYPFGPECWGQTTNDEHGEPKASPTINHVMALDFAIRKRAAESMNAGKDIDTALREA